jgi:hypothetical protein
MPKNMAWFVFCYADSVVFKGAICFSISSEAGHSPAYSGKKQIAPLKKAFWQK